MILAGRHVLLGVSGGIASYKACTLARRLAEAGTAVDVVLTAAAAEFVRPLTFEALTGRPVLTSLWTPGRALDHIALARDPDLVVLAPATANLLARAAGGIGDDVLTTILLAREGPVLAAPAMNDAMYAHPATQANLEILDRRGWRFIGPDVGPLAEGPSERPGRMAEPEVIFTAVVRAVRGTASPLRGRRVLVTAGPTREHLDPIRVVTNISSGRMGFALAADAYARGAEVTLLAGPTALTPPAGARVERVVTTADLAAAVTRHLPETDVLLMAAAPADYRPAAAVPEKRARTDGPVTVAFVPTDDILESTRAHRKPGAIIVGFAYETTDGSARARAKLDRKGLDLVVLNLDEPGAGAEVETNRITLVSRTGDVPGTLESKAQAAVRILDAVEDLL
ncbi:MAG: bifunctional phosphopantothenoylcysteine decarboxylase/phosphopantothenate--cysteine ligase CoaBC [Gemmatimonadota bacterium]|nr:bifunctional phosphopantothenoylcysteine decarboxylase/phosphopantothenate--cysteine ligase CoaBC [Gemmatimonadota bacterium]MDH5197911.1 bifunctional phosphopantothenoylcysteine decarboxylase/phosphopantothenate--cysteine ligase CoaBC [Gemmatimonadota bacterium]